MKNGVSAALDKIDMTYDELIVVAKGHDIRLNPEAQTLTQNLGAWFQRRKKHEIKRHHQEDRSNDKEDADNNRTGIRFFLLSHHASSFLKKPMSSS